jgi:hypothetical protein
MVFFVLVVGEQEQAANAAASEGFRVKSVLMCAVSSSFEHAVNRSKWPKAG